MSSTPPPPPPPGSPGDRPEDPSWGQEQFQPDPGQGAPPPDPTGGGQPGGAAPQPGMPDPAGGPGQPQGRQPNRIALWALILGAIAFPGALLIALLPVVNLLVFILWAVAIAAIVMGIVGIRRARRPEVRGGVGLGVGGIVLGSMHLLLLAALVALVVQFFQACDIDLDADPADVQTDVLECFEQQFGLELEEEELEELEDELEELDDQ